MRSVYSRLFREHSHSSRSCGRLKWNNTSMFIINAVKNELNSRFLVEDKKFSRDENAKID